MKKLIYSLFTLAFVLTGCVSWDDAVTEDYGKGADITLTLIATDDSIITFELAPSANAEYYSYAVYKGTEATVNATTLLKTTGGGIATGIFNVGEDPAATVKIGNLTPNTDYVVYAVASTKEGVIGDVKSATGKTTDKVIPGITGAKYTEDGQGFVLTFAEAVTRGEGAVTCKAYKEWDIANPVDVEADVAIDGNTVTLTAPTANPGAYIAFNWEEGAFIDATGLKCAAYTRSGLDLEAGEFTGLVTNMENVSFDLVPDTITPEVGTVIEDWTTFTGSIVLGDTFYIDAAQLGTGDITVIYTSSTREASYKLAYGEDWYLTAEGVQNDESGDAISIKLPAEPGSGEKISITINGGILFDVYGNSNNELILENVWEMFKEYTRDMVLNNYTWNYVSYWAEAGETSTENVVFEADPNDENGIIMKNMLVDGSEVLGTFDGSARTVYFPDWQVLFESPQDDGTTRYYMFTVTDTEGVTLMIDADGNMVAPASQSEGGLPWGIYVMQDNPNEGTKLGWYDISASDIVLTKSQPASAPRFRGSVHQNSGLVKRLK